MSIPLNDGFQNQTLERVLEDILVRFVINAPPEDLKTNERVFFLFEEAHWFYLDFIRNINPYLPSLKMKAFSKKLIELFPLIWKGGDPDEGLKEFGNYKRSIPVRGAALFNKNLSKILLVQGVESPNWSFPRGKIGKDEDDVTCAIREVKEEIGFDISDYINKDDYLERTIGGKNYKMYLVKDIPEDFEFKPLVRNEIAQIEWKDFKRVTKKSKTNPSKYFLVTSMIRPITSWIKKNEGEINENQLKKDVEAQLKFLLGIGQEERPTIDPGRELLDFIRTSTIKKQLKDDQEKINVSNLQQNNQQQQQLIYQQQLSHPVPNFGFQPPPFQNLPFINSFAPPPVPFINGVPSFPFMPPHIPMAPFPMQPYSNPQFHPQQQQPFPQRAPNPEELSRPSQGLRQRNENESKELLSILNGKSKLKQSNARELLALFDKNKKGSDETPNFTMLKRDDSKENGKDYSKNLLALLNKKPKSKSASPKIEEKVEKAEVEEIEAPKPKLKILKRDEPIPEVDQKEQKTQRFQKVKDQPNSKLSSGLSSGSSHDEKFYESAPPSKELLKLIKQSKQEQDEEFEMFEDFTDEEDEYDDEDSAKSVKDQNETEDVIEPEEFNEIDSEYESDEDVINEKAPEIKQSHAQPEQTFGQAPKKFKLLKRGEDLDSEPHPEPIAEPEVDDPTTHDSQLENESGTSTIQFSDDDDDEHESSRFIDETNDDLEKEDSLYRDDKTPKLVDKEATNGLLSLLKTSKSSEPPKNDNAIEPRKSNELLSLSNGSKSPNESEYSTPMNDLSNSFVHSLQQQQQPSIESIQVSEVPRAPSQITASNALLDLLKNPKQKQEELPQQQLSNSGAELLGLLHKNKSPEPVQIRTQQVLNTYGANDILNILHKNKLSEPIEAPIQQSVFNGGAELLNILHENKSPEPQPLHVLSPNGGAELLNTLHNSKAPKPEQSQFQSQPPQQQSTPQTNAAGLDLLNLLHRNKPEPEQSQPQQTFHQHESTGTPANDLLNMLHKKSDPSISSPQAQEEQSSKSGNSFLEFLMRK